VRTTGVKLKTQRIVSPSGDLRRKLTVEAA